MQKKVARLPVSMPAWSWSHAHSRSLFVQCSRYRSTLRMTSCFLVCDGSREVVEDGSCWVLTANLLDTTGWLCNDLNRQLSWSTREGRLITHSSITKGMLWPLSQLLDGLHSHEPVWYFPGCPTPVSFFFPTLPARLCALSMVVVGLVLPVLETKAVHVNQLWGSQSRPDTDTQQSSLPHKNKQCDTSCLFTEDNDEG